MGGPTPVNPTLLRRGFRPVRWLRLRHGGKYRQRSQAVGIDRGPAPAVRPIGHGVVLFAVGLLSNWTTAEVKIRVPGVTARPATGIGGERADLFRGGQDRIDEGGCLRRRLAKKSRRLKFGAAICLGEDRGRSLLDLSDRNRPGSQEADHNLDPTRDGAITPPPTANVSRFDPEYLGDALLREAKHTERLAEFDRSRAA